MMEEAYYQVLIKSGQVSTTGSRLDYYLLQLFRTMQAMIQGGRCLSNVHPRTLFKLGTLKKILKNSMFYSPVEGGWKTNNYIDCNNLSFNTGARAHTWLLLLLLHPAGTIPCLVRGQHDT